MSTVFEKLLSDEWPCTKVYEDEHVFAFMDAGQVNDGHVIVATKRPTGWQTVPHTHLRVLPRFEGDGAELTWPRKEPGIERLRELAARVRV